MLHNLADLEELWECIAEHSVHRQTWIRELDATLEQVEHDRGNLVCDTEKLLRMINHVICKNATTASSSI